MRIARRGAASACGRMRCCLGCYRARTRSRCARSGLRDGGGGGRRRAVVDGVAMVERDEEGEVALSMGGVGADHAKDWKYSRVGTESAAAPRCPSRR